MPRKSRAYNVNNKFQGLVFDIEVANGLKIYFLLCPEGGRVRLGVATDADKFYSLPNSSNMRRFIENKLKLGGERKRD